MLLRMIVSVSYLPSGSIEVYTAPLNIYLDMELLSNMYKI